jgi:hypothetical protein
MALIYDGRSVAGNAAVDGQTKSLRANLVPHSFNTYRTSGATGTIAAAIAANATTFAMRLDPAAGTRLAYITEVRLQFTTIVAFTVPITAGRRLGLFRGSGAATSGGTSIATGVLMDSGIGSASEFNVATGGDIRIATTAALTVTGITYETDPIATMNLVHVGAAGGFSDVTFDFSDTPLVLQPGQLLGVRNIPAMDAAGTWTLGVNVSWYESTAYNSTSE